MIALFWDNERNVPFRLSEVISIQIAYRKDKESPFSERMNFEGFGIQDAISSSKLCWVVRYGKVNNAIALPINQFRIEGIVDENKSNEIKKGNYDVEISNLFKILYLFMLSACFFRR